MHVDFSMVASCAFKILMQFVNTFKPNELSHLYQMDRSISVVRVVGWHFSFLLEFQ